MRSRSARISRVVVSLFLLGVAWGAWYIHHKGFGRGARQFISSEFRKRGVEIYLRRLTLDPFQGLVAQDVRIVDGYDEGQVLATISHVVLDINIGNLLQGEPFLDGIDLRNARVALPLDRDDLAAGSVELTGIQARLHFPPHQVYVSRAEADLHGLHLSATGRFINPESFNIDPDKKDPARIKRRNKLVRAVLDHVERLRMIGATAPRLEVTFSGDLAQPDKITVEGTLAGAELEYRGYQIRRLFIAASYANGAVNVKQCTLSDSQGGLQAAAHYAGASGDLEVQLRSDLDLQALLRPFRIWPPLEEFVFYSMPSVQVSIEANFEEQARVRVMGQIATGRLAVRSVHFDSFSATFSTDGESWYVRDGHLVHRSGEVHMSALQRPRDFRARMRSTIDPKPLAPLLTGKAARLLAEWDFSRSPELDLTARGESFDWKDLSADGHINLGPARFRGVALNRAQSDFYLADQSVTYPHFHLERDEGIASGTLTYDLRRHEVRVERVETTLIPQEVVRWIDEDLVRDLLPYRFKTVPTLRLDGVVQFEGGRNSDLQITVAAPEGMDYTFLKKELSFPTVSAKLRFTDRRLRISEASATLAGGVVHGGADISLGRGPQNYTATIHADDVNFADLTRLYFNYDDSQGLLNGTYAFSGRGDDARTIKGRGALTIVDGNVFAIPILGPFSGILNGIVPGMGFNHARRAASTFTIQEGIIRTDDFLVEGKGFSMIGGGALHFLDDRINFNVRINAQGLPGVLLFPVSKLFEYVADGSLSKTVWRPKRLPKFPP